MQGNNANNANTQRMGNMPGMMPMGGMGMGMPMMGMPMMGMPMMNPMMAMPMMNPMMGMGNTPNMGTAPPPQMGTAMAQTPNSPASILGTTGGLMPKIDTSPKLAAHLEPGLVASSGLQRERSRSRDLERPAESSPAPPPPAEKEEPVREKTPPRCHLHNTKKPNAKCKFCQKWIASQSSDKAEKEDAKEEKTKVQPVQQPEKDEEEDWVAQWMQHVHAFSTIMNHDHP